MNETSPELEDMMTVERSRLEPVIVINYDSNNVSAIRAWHSHSTVDRFGNADVLIRLEYADKGEYHGFGLSISEAERIAKMLTDAAHFASFHVKREDR